MHVGGVLVRVLGAIVTMSVRVLPGHRRIVLVAMVSIVLAVRVRVVDSHDAAAPVKCRAIAVVLVRNQGPC